MVDVARESADIILLEKSPTVLNDGVVEGRRVFGNVTKYLRMAGSSSFGNMFSMIGASALLPFSPFVPARGLTRLPTGYWWALAAILAGYLTLTQLVKAWVVRRFNLAKGRPKAAGR